MGISTTGDRAVLFGTGLMVGLAIGIPGGAWLTTEIATPDTVAVTAPTTLTEDDLGFDCATMGNMVCGPMNHQGAYPGRYVHGNLVEPWPVDVWGNDLAPGTFTWDAGR